MSHPGDLFDFLGDHLDWSFGYGLPSASSLPGMIVVTLAIIDGVVISPIYCVVCFGQTLDIPHVSSRPFPKHYASKSPLICISDFRFTTSVLAMLSLL